MSESTVCRLCITDCRDHHQSLFDSHGKPNELYELTREYFHPKMMDIEKAEHLTVMCLECYGHIEDFHRFQMSVVEAQLKLVVQNHEEEIQQAIGASNAKTIKPEIDVDMWEHMPHPEVFSIAIFPSGGEIATRSVKAGETEHSESEESELANWDSKPVEFEHSESEESEIANWDSKPLEIEHSEPEEGEVTTWGIRPMEIEHSEFESDEIPDSKDNNRLIEQEIPIPSPKEGHFQGIFEAGNDFIIKPELEIIDVPHTWADTEAGDISSNAKNKVTCKLCDKKYASTNGLGTHLREQHPGVWPSHFDTTYDATTQRFKCQLCGNSFAQKRHLTMHMRMLHEKQRQTIEMGGELEGIQCNLCTNSYRSIAALRLHYKKHHPGIKASTYGPYYDAAANCFKCQQCGKTFLQKMQLVGHVNRKHKSTATNSNSGHSGAEYEVSNHPVEETDPPNKECLKDFNSAGDDSSLKVNDTNNSFKCNLRQCNPDSELPEVESAAGKSATKRFTCKLCGNTFQHKCHLTVHFRRHHGIDLGPKTYLENNTSPKKLKIINCFVCENKFTTASLLQKHIKSQHPAIQPDTLGTDYDATAKCFKCNLCGNSFPRKRNLTAHIHWVHKMSRGVAKADSSATPEKVANVAIQYKCNICMNSATSAKALAYHVKKQHPGVCPSMLSSDYDVATKTYKCRICGLTCLRKMNLDIHMRKFHDNVSSEINCKYSYDEATKKFKCNYCSNSFSDKRNMTRHIRLRHDSQGVDVSEEDDNNTPKDSTN